MRKFITAIAAALLATTLALPATATHTEAPPNYAGAREVWNELDRYWGPNRAPQMGKKNQKTIAALLDHLQEAQSITGQLAWVTDAIGKPEGTCGTPIPRNRAIEVSRIATIPRGAKGEQARPRPIVAGGTAESIHDLANCMIVRISE